MTPTTDLVVVVADKCIEQAITRLLGRHQALGTRAVTHDLLVHPGHDPGCYTNAHELAQPYRRTHRHALVVFDLDWDGAPSRDSATLEAKVRADLARDWESRGACIVIEPELEAWAFSDSPHVDRVLGWGDRKPPLREWLVAEGHLRAGEVKPARPKEAFEAAIRKARERNSSSLFGELARQVSVDRCVDPSFNRLRATLRDWFPPRA